MDDVGQGDFESIRKADVMLRAEGVIVTFYDKKMWDLIMASSVNLVERVDASGKPTAGTRLKVPSDPV